MLLPLHPVTPEARHMKRFLEAMDKGGICVYPTDSGYSLGCDARSRPAVNRLYHLKRAMKKYQMALMVRDFSAVSDFARVDNFAYRYMKRLVPGPYTFVLPATAHGRKILDVKRPEVGVRMPAHPFVDALFALRPEAVLLTTAAKVREDEFFADPEEIDAALGHEVDLVMGMGAVAVNPTTVVSLVSGDPELIRQGQGPLPG
ncbi:MAG TPA: L-threonylcarbamoyladenylate synthase [Fibrobacteria bacterium]|nr:L-threonylcarbamoyladenylate synthase [Fibrobacteria bacterium]